MADFVPKTAIDPQAPNWTGASRGPDRSAYQPNRSFESLFSGIGEAVSGAASVAYSGIVEKAKNEWHNKLEPVRDAQGVGDLTAGATVSGKHPAGQPPQMESFADRASRLTAAYRDGRVGDTYYHSQLNAMSKEMRSKYPGFRDEVDSIIQKSTGIVPANALRNSVLAELQANRSKEDQAADRERTYALQNEKHWSPQMRERVAAGGPLPSVRELSPVVSGNEGRQRLVQATRGELELEQEQGRAVGGRAADQFQSEVQDLSGKVFKEAVTKLDQTIGKTLSSGAVPSAAELQQIEAAVQGLEMQFQNSVDRVLNGVPEGQRKSLAQLINDTEKVKKLREEALQPFMRIKDAISNQDFGLAKQSARFLSRMADAKGRELTTRFQSLETLAGLGQIPGGKEFIAQLGAIPGGAAVQTGVMKDIRDGFFMKQASGTGTLADEIREGNAANGGKDLPASYWKSRIEETVRTLADPKTSPEIRANLSKAFFNGALPFKEKDVAFRQLASPAVSAQMIANKDKQPEVYKQYADWMMKSFFTVHKQLGDDVNSIAESKAFTAKFNPGTNQFELGLTPEGQRAVQPRLRGALTDPLEAARRHIPGATSVIDSVNSMNKNLKVIEPVVRANGLEVGPEMEKLFKIQGTLPGAEKKKGWLDMLTDGVRSSVSKVSGEVSDQVRKETEAIGNAFGGAELNFTQASSATEGTGSPSLKRSEVKTGSADVDNLQPGIKKLLQDLADEGIVEEVKVNSGYRDSDRNRRAGGARASRHIQGDAIDIDVSGMSDEQKAQVLEAVVAKGAKGIGIYPSGNSIHIDTRDAPATWGYSPFGKYKGVTWDQQPEWSHGPLKKLFGAT